MIPTLQGVALEHHERLMWHVERGRSDPVAQDMGLTDVGRFGRRKQRQPLGLGEFAQKAKRPRPGPVL